MNVPVKPKIGSYYRHVLVCTGPRCDAEGAAQAAFDALGTALKAEGLDQGEHRVKRTRVSCFAACKGGPIVCVQPDGVWYHQASGENLTRIVREHLRDDTVVDALVFHQGPVVQR